MSWFIVLIAFLLASIKTTNNKNPSVSVVIPAYNEEKTVAKIVTVIKKIDYVNEILVVDDGSTDNTVKEAMSAGSKVISIVATRAYKPIRLYHSGYVAGFGRD